MVIFAEDKYMYGKIYCKSDRKNTKHLKKWRRGEQVRHNFSNKGGGGICIHH